VTGRIKSMKNSSGPIGNRTRDLSACRAVPQPTAPHVCVRARALARGHVHAYVHVASFIQHGMRIRRIVTSFVATLDSTIFFDIIS
jgi:hypothetical protein